MTPTLPTLPIQIEIPEELELAARQVREAVAESRKVRRILQETEAAITQARKELADAGAELQSAETAVALNKVPNATVAQKRFINARNAVDFALARWDGVVAQMTEPKSAEESARERLRLGWQKFALEQIDLYHQRYRAGVQKFLELVDEGIALSVGFAGTGTRDVPRLQERLQRVQILGSLEEKEFFRVPRAYENNTAATGLRDELIALKKALFNVEKGSE